MARFQTAFPVLKELLLANVYSRQPGMACGRGGQFCWLKFGCQKFIAKAL